MSDEPEHRITTAPGRGVGPPAPSPEEAGDPLDDLLRTLRPPSRLGAWVVGLAAIRPSRGGRAYGAPPCVSRPWAAWGPGLRRGREHRAAARRRLNTLGGASGFEAQAGRRLE